MNDKPKLRLLFDLVPIGSPGALRLTQDLAIAVGETCPPDAEITVLLNRTRAAVDLGPKVRTEYVDLRLGQSLEESRPYQSWPDRYRWFNQTLVELAEQHSAHVVFSGSGILSSPLSRRCGLVATINNMLPFTPEQILSYPTFSWTRVRIALLRHILLRSLTLADVVVLHSQHALDRLSEYYGELPEKANVVLSGVPTWLDGKIETTPQHPYEGRPYVFYLSAVRAYKNHLNLIEAYRLLSEKRSDLPDLLFGGFATEQRYLSLLQDTISKYGLQGKINYIGTIDDEDVPAWLHHATINVFPSLCETNSLVISEILGSSGVLACSSIPPMSEVGGDAAELFEASDPGSIAEVVGRLLDNPDRRKELRRRAVGRSLELSWEQCGLVVWDAARRAQKAFAKRTEGNRVT